MGSEGGTFGLVGTGPALVYATEALNEALRVELLPLLAAHWAEVGLYRDIPIDPDWDAYHAVQEARRLRVFTARVEGRLVGYAVWIVSPWFHAKGKAVAVNDLLYIHPDYRKGLGGGTGLMLFSRDRFRLEGVTFWTVTANDRLQPLMKRMGLVDAETAWFGRLD